MELKPERVLKMNEEEEKRRKKKFDEWNDHCESISRKLLIEENEETRKRLRENLDVAGKQRDSYIIAERLAALPTNETGGALFTFCQALNREIHSKTSGLDDVFDFQVRWWCSKSETSTEKLYVRDCYKTLFDKCVKAKDEVALGKFLLEGTPGTGKSGFGIYAIIRFVRMGYAVWYRWKGQSPMIFVGNQASCSMLHSVFPRLIFEPNHVYALPYDAEQRLETLDGLVRVIDPLIEETVKTSGSFFDVVVSSPDCKKLGEIRKAATAIYYIPLWSREEVRRIAPFHPVFRGQPLDDFLVEMQFDEFGGAPRNIFKSFSDSRDVLSRALRKVTLTDLKQFYSHGDKGKILPILIHMEPTSDFTNYIYKTASTKIEERLIDLFGADLTNDLDWWLIPTRESNLFGGIRGRIKEFQWHQKISRGGSFHIRRLGTAYFPLDDLPKFRTTLTLSSFEVKYFGDLGELTSLPLGLYFKPKSSIFETFDAFCLLPFQMFVPNTEGLCIVGFQMTISKRHSLKRKGMVELKAKVQKILGEIPLIIVFVSEADGISSVQPIYGASEKNGEKCVLSDLDRVPELMYLQYVITE